VGDAPPMPGPLALETVADGVALITLQRPEKLNALSWEMVEDLHAAFERLAADASIRVVIMTGAGRGFCSGMDLGGDDAVGTASDMLDVLARQERLAALATALRELPQPVIAAVNGPAAGGGMALALACDIRVCAPEARFNVAFVRIGLSGCDVGVSHLLPRIVGLGVASELMLTGRPVGAEEALRIGLANRVVAQEELLDASLALAAEIARNSPFGVRMTKQVLHRNVDAPSLEAALELENRTQVLATQTDDMREALAAFVGKREPNFTGR
jgi:enoyl-CoA hydratase